MLPRRGRRRRERRDQSGERSAEHGVRLGAGRRRRGHRISPCVVCLGCQAACGEPAAVPRGGRRRRWSNGWMPGRSRDREQPVGRRQGPGRVARAVARRQAQLDRLARRVEADEVHAGRAPARMTATSGSSCDGRGWRSAGRSRGRCRMADPPSPGGATRGRTARSRRGARTGGPPRRRGGGRRPSRCKVRRDDRRGTGPSRVASTRAAVRLPAGRRDHEPAAAGRARPSTLAATASAADASIDEVRRRRGPQGRAGRRAAGRSAARVRRARGAPRRSHGPAGRCRG